MDLRIYIPTLGRINRQPTFTRLPAKLQKLAFIVCPLDEVTQHVAQGRAALPCPAKGISATRDWIMEHAHRKGFKRIVMLDDDLVMQRKRADGKISNLEPAEYEQAFKWLDTTLKTRAHASFGPRFLGYDLDVKEMVGKRMMYVLGYNVPEVRRAKGSFTRGMPPMPVMEDFHMTLQLLKAGLPNVLSLEWRVSPYASNYAGGCSTWRNLERINASAKRLAALHPGLVTLRPKKNWNGLEGEQWDVTVGWLKALKQGGGEA